MLTGRIELHDVMRDEAEKYDIARNHPEVVREIKATIGEVPVAHSNWKPPAPEKPPLGPVLRSE